MTDQPIDHDVLDDALKRCGSSWNAGQVHGLLCSRLTVSGSEGATRWFEQVLNETDPNNALRAECEQLLDSMCATTWRQLVERQSEFTLLLPHDEDAALKRAESMAQWCEGYLHGLVNEGNEDAYVELVEYLRVAVQLVYEELADFRSRAEDNLPDDNDTLH
jgi:uncharacterized protein YgfB (UPF0149 family)